MKIITLVKEFIKNRFRKPFILSKVGAYGKFSVENGCKIILHRTTIKHHSPSAAGIITIGTGISIDLKPGYCGILEPRNDISKSGLVMANTPKVIMPGDNREVTFDFFLSQNSHFSEMKNYYEPYELGQVIGYLTVLKTL